MMSSEQFLLVIPVYKDARRLARFGQSVVHALAEANLPVRWVIADDGSGAAEVEQLRQLCAQWQPIYPHIEVFANSRHLGKGGIVRTAFAREANADWLAFVDADGSISAEDMLRLLRTAGKAQAGTALLASRRPDPATVVEQSPMRRCFHRTFAGVTRWYLRLPVYDTQCGAKVFNRRDFATILPALREDGFAFDVEWLLALVRSGVFLKEVPVSWKQVGASSLRPFAQAWIMSRALIRVKNRLAKWQPN